MSIPTEISAAAILITFWDDNVSRLFRLLEFVLADRHTTYSAAQPCSCLPLCDLDSHDIIQFVRCAILRRVRILLLPD